MEELKAVHKKLKEQHARSRIMLEQAMEDCTRFEENELRKLMKNPVIWPLLRNLSSPATAEQASTPTAY